MASRDRPVVRAAVATEMFGRRGLRRVMVLGGQGLAEPLREAGIEAVLPGSPEFSDPAGSGVDAVFVGWFPEFTMPALEAACQAVWAGAPRPGRVGRVRSLAACPAAAPVRSWDR